MSAQESGERRPMDAARLAALLRGHLAGPERERALNELAEADADTLKAYADLCITGRDSCPGNTDPLGTELAARLADLDQGAGVPADAALRWLWERRRKEREARIWRAGGAGLTSGG